MFRNACFLSRAARVAGETGVAFALPWAASPELRTSGASRCLSAGGRDAGHCKGAGAADLWVQPSLFAERFPRLHVDLGK